MNCLAMKSIILILICVSAADDSGFFTKKPKTQQFCMCKIIKYDIAVLCIDESDHIQTCLMPVTWKYFTLIAFYRYMEKLAKTILVSYETIEQIGKFHLCLPKNSEIK